MLEKLTSSKVNIVSLIVIVITMGLIFITETDWFLKFISYQNKEINKIDYYMFWKFGIQNLSFFFMGLSGISLLWELYSKRSFTNEILEKVNLSANINDSGVIKIYKSFQDIQKDDWDNLLRSNVKFLKLFFSSSTIWMRSHVESIQNINNKKRPIEIYMPNFKNSKLLESLAIKDNESVEIIKNKIEISYNKFLKMKKINSKLEIILVDEVPIMTFYMNENKIIIATYSLISKDERVPTFIAKKDGDFYAFAEKEIKYLGDKYKNKTKVKLDGEK